MEGVKELIKEKSKKKNSVFMDKVCSMEYYKNKDGVITQVLKDISFISKESDLWVVTGDSLFEIKLLLEILANTKPYQKGKCVLVETGMMRKKRIILNHTFYIGNVNMPFNNMKVLEYLMLATGKNKGNVIERQEKILDLIIELGLGYISLSEINKLKDEEKSIVSLLVSALSNSELIVFNVPLLNFDDKQIEAIKNISKYIKSLNKTLILSTMNIKVAEKVGDNILILRSGKVIYNGEKKEFIERYDKVIFRVYSEDNIKLLKYLKNKNDLFKYRILEDYIEISIYEDFREDKKDIYNMIIDSGIEILKIERNILNVDNAYKELVKRYDLQK